MSFENTLGKIAATVVTAPRPLIDVAVRRSPVQSAHVSRRRLYRTVENAYMVVMAVEDLDMEMLALPPQARPVLVAQRDALMAQLYGMLGWPGDAEDEGLVRLLGLGKAQRLVGRVASLAGPVCAGCWAHDVRYVMGY